MHGLDAEPGKEPKGKQIQIPVYKTVQPELGLSVFACLMVHHFLADFLEAGVLGQVRDVAVHFAVYFYILDHLFAIRLQSAIKVVQVFDARYFAGGGIEQFGGEGLRQRVVTFLLPARYEVIAVLGNHAVEFGYFVGAVLQVGVHGYHDVALCLFETTEQCRRLPVVAAELNAPYLVRSLCLQLLDNLPRTVGTSVVNENHFV